MSPKIDIRGEAIRAAAPTLAAVLQDLLRRIRSRDPELELSRLTDIIAAEDYPGALRAAGAAGEAAGAARLVHSAAGMVLVLDGRQACAALAGEPEALVDFIHLFHRELCRAHYAAAGMGSAAPASAFEGHFLPATAGMAAEYCANRRAAWSLPAGSDLLLPHLAELLDLVPASLQEEIMEYQLDSHLDSLVTKALPRLTHLLQSAAYSLGYLAGIGRSVGEISPELKQRIDASVLGEAWDGLAQQLDDLYAEPGASGAALLDSAVTVLARLGIKATPTEGGAMWVEVAPLSTEDAAAALARLSARNRPA